MFENMANCPLAVTSPDLDGLREGIDWCLRHLEPGQHLTVWTHLKSNLSNEPVLENLVTRHSNVDHVTERGGAYLSGAGPVLMAWAGQNDIASFARANARSIRALCVVAWETERLHGWVAAARPEILGNPSLWDQPEALDPVVEEALRGLTMTINHNNTIAAGYEKDYVVSVLLALHDAGYQLDGPALSGWATANGWVGDNPALLEKYVAQINRGSRPRVRRKLDAHYIERLLLNAGVDG